MPTVIFSLVTGDCSRLIPACWQELHYLFAGIIIGGLFGLLLGAYLYRRWTRPFASFN